MDYDTTQACKLITDKGGALQLMPAERIRERKLKRAVTFPRIFENEKHIGGLKALKKYMRSWREPKIMTTVKEVPARRVTRLDLVNAWRVLPGNSLFIQFLDRNYWATTEEDFNRIIRETHVERAKYRTDRLDCDNFAIRFSAEANKYGINTVGIIDDISGRHAYNGVFLDRDGEIIAKIFEPQTDRFVTLGQGLYVGKLGVAVFC